MLQFIASARDRLAAAIPQLSPGHRTYRWWVLGALSIGAVMPMLDSTIVNVAIAKLEAAFGATTDAVQWVITAYILAYAVMLTASGWLADRFGYKTMLLSGIALFTLGSLLCSLSWSLESLVFFRVIQGAAGGSMAGLATAIVRREFPRDKLGIAMGFLMIPTLSSTSFGPTIGGWLIDHVSWQMMFDINVPIGIVSMVAVYVVVRSSPRAQKHPFDFEGFAAAAIALGSLLLALADSNAAWNACGWGSAFTLSCLGASAFAFAAFFIIELTTDHPLIDLSLFKSYNFSLSMVVAFVFGLGMFGSDFLLPLYLQVGLGYTPTQAGLIFIPYGFVMIAANVVGGRLTDRIGGKVPGMIGILLRAWGMYRLVFLSEYSSNSVIVWTVCIAAAGMGFLVTPLQTTMIASSPVAKAAQASGLMIIVRQLGGSFGVAMLSAILTARDRLHLAMAGQAMSPASPTYGQVLTQLANRAQLAVGGPASDAMARAKLLVLSHLRTHAFVSAIDDVFLVALVVSLVTSVPFLFLKMGRARQTRGEAAIEAPRDVEFGQLVRLRGVAGKSSRRREEPP